jgi:hypothetical protein
MPDPFDQFWSHYPRKVAKAEARKAWAQTVKIRPGLDELIGAVLAQCQCEQWRKNNGSFIPYPATWLRGERWCDECEVCLPAPIAPVRVPDRYDQANAEFEARYGGLRAVK